MNLGDPELELIDPTPNIHNLFLQFDKLFFSAKLASRAVVRWSKRMYSSAGVCSYEGRGGLCDIALSEPLLKLRPRKNLIETLLHEMIHAFLFITCRDNDRDGHGPNFQAHMHRINRHAGINISIYHDFHEEVELYLTHVWRCNGPCQQRRPYFGIVRKALNSAPGPRDFWWENHLRYCGGKFIKIQEPNKANKKIPNKIPPKPNADITKYITTNKTVSNVPQKAPVKPVLKDSNIMTKTKSNGGNTLVISKKEPVYNPQIIKNPLPILFSGKGQTLTSGRPRSNSVGVVETVRSIWANKQIPKATNSKQVTFPNKGLNSTVSASNRTTKHKIESNNSPPAKVQKIDDYFKTKATSLLKDIYGKDFQITQSNKDHTVIAVADTKSPAIKPSEGKSSLPNKQISSIEPKPSSSNISTPMNLVDCPVCKAKVSSNDINRHLDECLNKDVIDSLCKDTQIITPSEQPFSNPSQNSVKEIVGDIPKIPTCGHKNNKDTVPITNKISAFSNSVVCPPIQNSTEIARVQEELNSAVMVLENGDFEECDPTDNQRVKAIAKKINYDKVIQSDKDPMKLRKEKMPVDIGFLPSANVVETPKIIKIEPGNNNETAIKAGHTCPCCGKKIEKPIEEHLDECLAFFDNNNSIPNEGASTSLANETIVIDDDDDDIFDESQIYNATGTKTPCPCCLTMVEEREMVEHLDFCLS